MKYFFLILLWLISAIANAQAKDSLKKNDAIPKTIAKTLKDSLPLKNDSTSKNDTIPKAAISVDLSDSLIKKIDSLQRALLILQEKDSGITKKDFIRKHIVIPEPNDSILKSMDTYARAVVKVPIKDSVFNNQQSGNAKSLLTAGGSINQKPEILSGGFIDFVQTGQMNASARLMRLYIGEPGKFQVPVSIYTGVSANSLSAYRQNEDFVLNLINPGSGIFNMCFDGTNKLAGIKTKVTSLQLQYQVGFRFLSVYDRRLFKNSTFFNAIGSLGLTFVTGAWEKNKANNIGVFWLNVRGLCSNNPPSVINSILEEKVIQNLLGYSVGMGIEISQATNVKIFYFRFLNNRSIAAFTPPFIQLSFNYSMR